jgi:hypothetical protein
MICSIIRPVYERALVLLSQPLIWSFFKFGAFSGGTRVDLAEGRGVSKAARSDSLRPAGGCRTCFMFTIRDRDRVSQDTVMGQAVAFKGQNGLTYQLLAHRSGSCGSVRKGSTSADGRTYRSITFDTTNL